MKKVLVTGATGFVGRYVIRELLKEGFQVIATSRSAQKARTCEWWDRVDYIPFDLGEVSEENDYYHFFKKPDLLIHLAWEGLPDYKAAFHLERNLPRHKFFLENLVRNGLEDMTVAGTCLEYGLQEGCLTEDLPAMPVTAYGKAKDQLQFFLTGLTVEHGFRLKWVRLFYMYGEGQNPNSLLSQLQRALDKGEQVFAMSPGDQLRDFLPVETVAGNIVAIAGKGNLGGGVNCCSGMPISVKELVLSYLQSKGATIRLEMGVYPYPDYEPKDFWGDVSKLRDFLSSESLSNNKL